MHAGEAPHDRRGPVLPGGGRCSKGRDEQLARRWPDWTLTEFIDRVRQAGNGWYFASEVTALMLAERTDEAASICWSAKGRHEGGGFFLFTIGVMPLKPTDHVALLARGSDVWLMAAGAVFGFDSNGSIVVTGACDELPSGWSDASRTVVHLLMDAPSSLQSRLKLLQALRIRVRFSLPLSRNLSQPIEIRWPNRTASRSVGLQGASTGRGRCGAHVVSLATYMGHVNIYATYW